MTLTPPNFPAQPAPDGSEEDYLALSVGRWTPISNLVPEWVTLNFGAVELKIYITLLMHVNHSRPESVVWPSKATIARRVGLCAKSITPYLEKLELGGAIDIIRNRAKPGTLNSRNSYIIHNIPPDGFTGAVNNVEQYARDKVQAPKKPVDNRKTPARSVVPSTGLRRPVDGTLVGPSTGPELVLRKTITKELPPTPKTSFGNELAEIIEERRANCPHGRGGSCRDCGTSPREVATAQAELSKREHKRSWCGVCDERTRQIDEDTHVRRCPQCHPLIAARE